MKLTSSLRYTGLVLVLCLFSGNLSAQPAEVRIMVAPEPGSGMFTDVTLGLDAATHQGSSLRFVLQIRSEGIIGAAALGWLFYSPDNSITAGALIENVQLVGPWATFEVWSGGSGFFADSIDGVLPDRFIVSGVAICHDCEPNTGGGGFQNPSFTDFVEWTVAFDSAGVFCMDSSFFPPAADFLAIDADGNFIGPLWFGGGGDLSVGGTRTEAFCVNVLERNCCATPGDANHDGMVNIADASYLVSRIFANGAPPACCREADANGDGRMNIADITYMVRRIFAGGPAPICGGPVDNC